MQAAVSLCWLLTLQAPSDDITGADEASQEAVLAKRASDLDLTLSQLSALRSRISELEAQLESSRRECCKSQELNAKLQFDLHEVWRHIISYHSNTNLQLYDSGQIKVKY